MLSGTRAFYSGHIAGHTLGPVVPLLQSVTEGAARCICTGSSGSQDETGLLDKFIKSPPVCCRDAAAPADYSIENE